VHEKRIALRWRDLDASGHVNNAVYLTYIEELLDDWLARTLEAAPTSFVTAHVAIDFRRELRLSDEAVVGRCALVRLGTTSLTTRAELFAAGGALAAEADVVLVAYEPASRRPRPLTAAERVALEAHIARAQDGAASC
jgi:acyl-CoA thioester hydrolase